MLLTANIGKTDVLYSGDCKTANPSKGEGVFGKMLSNESVKGLTSENKEVDEKKVDVQDFMQNLNCLASLLGITIPDTMKLLKQIEFNQNGLPPPISNTENIQAIKNDSSILQRHKSGDMVNILIASFDNNQTNILVDEKGNNTKFTGKYFELFSKGKNNINGVVGVDVIKANIVSGEIESALNQAVNVVSNKDEAANKELFLGISETDMIKKLNDICVKLINSLSDEKKSNNPIVSSDNLGSLNIKSVTFQKTNQQESKIESSFARIIKPETVAPNLKNTVESKNENNENKNLDLQIGTGAGSKSPNLKNTVDGKNENNENENLDLQIGAGVGNKNPNFINTASKVETKQAIDNKVIWSDIKNQIVDNLVSMPKQGNNEITITLFPESLGKLSLKITTDSEGIKAQIITSKIEVRDEINQQSVNLREILKDQGFKVNSIEVQYKDNVDGWNFNSNTNQRQQNHNQQRQNYNFLKFSEKELEKTFNEIESKIYADTGVNYLA